MRGTRMNGMINGEVKSTFLSCEKDLEAIVDKLFVQSKPYSDELKRLLVINTPDCLRDRTNPAYLKAIKNMSPSHLHEQGYIRTAPRITINEHENVKSYIIIAFDGFLPSGNPHFRDCIVEIDIICHHDYWDLGNFQLRPLKIAGYIDGILNNNKLSGLGTLNFLACDELVFTEDLSGYCLRYAAVHDADSDDSIPNEDEE